MEPTEKEKTRQQKTISDSKEMRGALHLWLEQVAHEANNMGLTLQDMVAQIKNLEVCPTKNNLKETFIKPYIKSAFQLTSTEKMTAEQVTKTYDAMNKLISTHWHIYLPFPNEEERQRNKQ